MEQLAIYLWSISENIQDTLIIFGAVSIATAFVRILAEEYKPRLFKASIALGVFLFILASCIPSKQELAVLLLYPAAKDGVQEIAQSETVKQIQEVGNLYLQQKIKELKEKQ